MLVHLNGREIDLRRALPLTLRDWKALEKQGININTLSATPHVADVVALVTYTLQKADPTTTADEVEGLTFEDDAVTTVLQGVRAGKAFLTSPSSTPSTSSPAPTDGPSTT